MCRNVTSFSFEAKLNAMQLLNTEIVVTDHRQSDLFCLESNTDRRIR